MRGQDADRLVRITSWLAGRPWWQLAILAGIVGTAANFAIFAVAAWPAGIDVVGLGPIPLTLSAIALYSIVPAIVATMLAASLTRRTVAPWRWFVAIAMVVLLLSFGAPPLMIEASVANLVMLELMHVVTAAVIVAALSARLGSAGIP